jgi:phospholipid/cholesterol/gamma-HCH transport system substrate-binding protein
VAFIFSISDFSSFFQKGTTLKVVFQYANGLKKGAPVRVAGVDTGHIQEIRVVNDPALKKTMVEAQAWLMSGISVPQDSTLVINQLGILGEKYLEIIPGTSSVMADGQMSLRGEDPVPMEEIMKKMSGIALKIDETLGEIQGGIMTEENKKAVSEMLANIAAVTRSIRDGEGTIGGLLNNSSVYKNLEELSADLKAHPWKLFYRPKGSK